MKVSFKNRILAAVVTACVVCTGTAIFVSSKQLGIEGKKNLIEKASAILSRVEVGAHYVAQMHTLDGVIKETLDKYPDGKITEEQRLKILKSVPIYAAFEIGKHGAAAEHYEFRIASDAPRQKENKATDKEIEVINKFKSDPKLKEVVEESADGKFILVSRPIRIAEDRGCLICHGHPSKSPWGNGKDVLGYQMEDMKDGDLRATFTIISSLEPLQAATKASTFNITMWGSLITILAALLGFLAIRKPVANLTGLANDLSQTADDVAKMSSEIATTSLSLSSGATEQAAAIEETSASMEEMSAMVSRNSEGAEKSRDIASQSQQKAEEGKSVVQEMIQSIEEIDQSNEEIMKQMEESNRQITEIVQIITEIGNKTKVINEIVFQTKLLSFNASVEAARAGEQGKGFAVVAEEVGNLANMSGRAAADITQMLDSSIQKVEAIVQNTKSKVDSLVKAGKIKVERGTEVAKQCEEVLNEIVQNAQGVYQVVAQISEGSNEQSKGVLEINKAMVQLNNVTQMNTAASQESSTAAEKLSNQARQLRESVQSVLTTLEGGSSEYKQSQTNSNMDRNLFQGKKVNNKKLYPHADEFDNEKKQAS